MLENIGAVDSELRDDLIFTCLYEWIARKPVFSVQELRGAFPLLLDSRHMFFRIAEEDTDAVFTRSFSVLALALILYRHRQEAFLSREDLQHMLEALCRFVSEERDLRGFVPGSGWVHAIAHSADALDELVQCQELDKTDLSKVLQTILRSMSAAQAPYVQREDERMVTALLSLLGRNLIPMSEVVTCLVDAVTAIHENPPTPLDFSRWNFRNFLRALYFRLLREGWVDYAAEILSIEASLSAMPPL
jgi:hypothetical protein